MAIEHPIQNVLYSLSEGGGRAVLRGFIMAALLVLIGLAYTGRQFGGLRDAHNMELAQLARNLVGSPGTELEFAL